MIEKKVWPNRKTWKNRKKVRQQNIGHFHLQGRIYIISLEKSSSPYQDYNKKQDFAGSDKSDGLFLTLYLRHT